MVVDLLNTACVALLRLLLSTCSQLLLSQRHLLLHVADLLLGPPTVLLEKETEKGALIDALNVCGSLAYSKISSINHHQPPLLEEVLPHDFGTKLLRFQPR